MIVKYDRLKANFWLRNPGGRRCTVGFKDCGWFKNQVFTSEDLPDKIPYELVGLVMFPDGIIRPKYKANVVTKTKLYLSGKTGYRNGVKIVNRICHELCFQNEFFEAKSIKRSDLKNIGDEKFSYWIASSAEDEIMSVENMSENIPICGASPCSNNSMVFSHSLCAEASFAVRPVVILDIEIDVESQSNVTWVSL